MSSKNTTVSYQTFHCTSDICYADIILLLSIKNTSSIAVEDIDLTDYSRLQDGVAWTYRDDENVEIQKTSPLKKIYCGHTDMKVMQKQKMKAAIILQLNFVVENVG